ncbi:MAG TPA: exonuclease domain-containing protein [Gemmatimonadaceae bacterium]|jgi:DNA polymerase-3 subunit epsilon
MKAFATCRFIVVDVETTGTSHGNGDRVTEVAAVVVEDGEIRDGFHSLVNPQRPIPWRITALTGISDEMVAGAPPFSVIAAPLAEVLQGRIFVAHNAPFDWGFLGAEFARAGFPEVMQGPPLCTVRLARRLLAHLPRRNLDAVAFHYGVNIESRHRALGDARATARVLQGLLHDVEKQGVDSLDLLRQWMARRVYARKRRTAMPTWVADKGLGEGA